MSCTISWLKLTGLGGGKWNLDEIILYLGHNRHAHTAVRITHLEGVFYLRICVCVREYEGTFTEAQHNNSNYRF